MKKCKKCGIEKDLGEFYEHRFMLDGHLNICKDCVKERVRDRSRSEQGRIYDHQRNQGVKRKKWLLAYQKKRRNLYKLTVKCRNAFSKAMISGKLVKQPCEVCGELIVQGHHDDYTKPLQVRWLCGEHHRQLHKQYKRIS